MTKKLFRVEISTEVVVLAEDLADGVDVAESSISDIDNWSIEVGKEVKEEKDLPMGWVPGSIPWGVPYGTDATIAQIWDEVE